MASTSTHTQTPPSKYSAAFWAMVVARFFITFAVQLQATTLGGYLYQVHQDPLELGLVGLFEAIPALSLALFAGAWVDRHSSTKVYRYVILVSAVSISISASAHFSNSGILNGLFHRSVFQLFLVAACVTGLARAFYGPVIQTIIPLIVHRQQITQASAWMTFSNRIGMVLGPMMGGFFLAWHSFFYSQLAALVATFISFLATFFLPKLAPSQKESREPVLQSLTLGLRFVFQHQLLLPAFALDMFAVLFGGAVAILPAFTEDVLGTDGSALGVLRAAPAVGAMITGALLTRYPPRKNTGALLFKAMFGYGFSLLLFAFSKSLWPAALFLFISGAFDSVNMIIRGALVQLASPNEYRGRIASVNSMFIGSSNEIGAFESGMAAKIMGLVPSLYFGATMTLAIVSMAYFNFKLLRRISLTELEESPRLGTLGTSS